MYVACRLLDRQLQAQRSRRRRLSLKPPPRGRRPCNRKRARHAAARMDEPPDANARWSLFVSTRDCPDALLVYGVRFEEIPPSSAGSVAPESVDPILPWSEEEDHMHSALAADGYSGEFRPSMEPVIRWSEEKHLYSALAAVSGGTILALVDGGSTRTVVHDGSTGTDTVGPRLRGPKPSPIMLPVGDDDTVLVMNEIIRPGRHCFEALSRLPAGGWRADALPDPPLPYMDSDDGIDDMMREMIDDEDIYNPGLGILAYFARGSRAWISVWKVGTLSLDMDSGAWRMEGTWELPLHQRGFFVPELGLVVGVPKGARKHSMDKERCWEVCALDVVEARPPAVRRVWKIPPERLEEVSLQETVSLAYLGNGRFCIARSIDVKVPTDQGCLARGTSFTLLDMRRLPGGDLELARHGKVHGHAWPWGHVGHALFL